VEWVKAEPPRDFLGRGPCALGEQPAQDLARPGVPPPVPAHLATEVRLELRRADPGSQVVGRVKAGVHVRQVSALVVAETGWLGEQRRVVAGRLSTLGRE